MRGPEPRALELEVVPLNAWARLLLEQRGGGKVPVRVKVLSFIPTASKVIAVNGKEEQ